MLEELNPRSHELERAAILGADHGGYLEAIERAAMPVRDRDSSSIDEELRNPA
jgi:hypothetical protein